MESCEFPWTRSRSWRRFRCSLPSPFRGTELRVFRCHNEIRFPGPCQDADEGFGFQEKLEAVALLQCESSLYAYYCEFGVPCECSREITTAGQCSQAPSVAMWTRCHRAGFRPFPHRNRGCYDSVTVSISAPLLLVFLRVESVRTLPKHDQVKLVGQWFRRHVQRHGSACWR